ncbi:zinc/manganese transport system substrate-binding protein [Pseudarthrobacter siccitolerans]|uniref:Zinc/manganese transport system substrate-binding protein n=1 Tax=Pseudarthrobacter siccitolerans TaxID=861266 RepID=A0ABU0PHH2_9MICC|nr:zinc ABC transporter substrate-binding protein [Pseudarthrobacter siccitolerans]MDQ0673410.1 zinc/manganese transport system substrate-binding protein [Pseudarthrobacter siccitolerans]
MRRPAAARTSLAVLAVLGLLLSACSPQPEGPAGNPTEGINVVASTNVYGDIAKMVGGDKVSVTAIINKTSQDPHSYEATAQDRLAVSKADLVVENGGGYDDFLHTLVEDSSIEARNVLNAVELSGLAHPEDEATGEAAPAGSAAADDHAHDHGEFNEHVWYSLAAMGKLADDLAARLGGLEPGSAATFTANAGAFKSELDELAGKLGALKTAAAGGKVAVTEPVPLYLLADAGLENSTPEDYIAAVEEGSDVPPAVLKAATDLISSKSVRFLAYNGQTEGPQTEALRKAAETAGVPVVDFSETLPEGKTYLQWMTDNVNNVSKVLETNR